jgi:outer membrane cobalamin receptor
MQQTTSGMSTFGEAALGARAEWRGLRVDAAVGGLLPFGNPSAVWPEAKLTVGVRPWRGITVLLIGARKGRLPTIRELYDPIQGNAKLNPEFVWHGEVQMQAQPHPLVALRFSGYFRRIDGFIRLDPTQGGGTGNMTARNVNLDTINVRGCETGFDLLRDRIVGGGLTYVFEDAYSLTLGNQPIANFPTHKVDAYLSSTFWRRRLGALLRVRFVSERVVQASVLPRYTILELDLWGRISKSLRASVRIDNLTNASYQLLPGLNALGTTATATVEGVWE